MAIMLALCVWPLVGMTACTEPSLTVTTVVRGLDHPWDIGFLPNGTMLVTERAGRLSRIVNGQPKLVAAPRDVLAIGEAGVMGLAVDPQFRSNGYVFVCLASTKPSPPDVRIVRYKLAPDGSRVLQRADVFTGMPMLPEQGHHVGCRPRFGPDGALWVGTGDATTGTVPQDPFSWGGKTLRLRRDGKPASGNPYGLPWYTRGHRNVQGIAFRPSDGLPVSVEQGTDRDDEVNIMRFGGNYG